MFCQALSLAIAVFGGLLFLASWGSVWTVPAPLVAKTEANPCHPWEMVNVGAFGLGTGADKDYRSEESFELAAYKGSLYLGMEADNSLGARLWWSKPGVLVPARQADWEEVAALEDAPFGNLQQQNGILQNDHIDSLAVFRESLYVSTANGGETTQGIFVYRSPTGAANSWTPVIEAGFGSPQNTNFKDMQLFHGWLCGGTQNWETGTQVWCTADGEKWVQKSHGGFGATGDSPDVVTVWSGYVFDDALYFGAQSAENRALLYRTGEIAPAHPSWTRVYTGAAGSYRVDLLGVLDGYLYIAVPNPGHGLAILRSSTGNAASWSQVNGWGMDGNPANSSTVVDGATTYNDALYVSVTNKESGVEVWRTTGALQAAGTLVDWLQIGESGLGDSNNYYAELLPFNGYLYAWTSNYASGQQVRRTVCPRQQERELSGAGQYEFDSVGATITFTQGAPDVLKMSLYPGALPTGQKNTWPLARYYQLTSSSPSIPFVATLTLSYRPEELTTADIDSTSLYLVRWDSALHSWVPCPAEKRAYDLHAQIITCRDVTELSFWTFANKSVSPLLLRELYSAVVRGRWLWLLISLSGRAICSMVTRQRPTANG
ncbi:MAG: hypothetical protein K8R89_08745 [Anaerolineae bacterium]|nr:hypothetical protein [Anaerolineae bacterium]